MQGLEQGRKDEQRAAGGSRWRLLFFVVFALLTAALGALAFGAGWVDQQTVRHWLGQAHSPLGMVSYLLLAVASHVLWFPRMWTLLAAGLLFGPLLAVLLSFVADMVSGSFFYAFSRGLGARFVGQQLARHPRLEELVALLAARRGLLTVFLMRVLPISYTGTSYAGGLANVQLRTYLLGTALGILPGTVLFTAVGHSARDPASPWFFVGVGVVVVTACLGLYLLRQMWRTFRGTLAESSPEEPSASGES